MGVPKWWSERRFGIVVHAGTSTVPAWCPIGANAAHYRRYLGDGDADDARPVDGVGDAARSDETLVEVLAHHRDRWGHLGRYDDFVELLRWEHFDADAWAALAREAGAGYAAVVARSADGWTGWTPPGSADASAQPDVVGTFANACARHGLVAGAYYETTRHTTSAARLELADLVDRTGLGFVRIDGPVTADDVPVGDDVVVVAADTDGIAVGPVRPFEWDPPRDIVAEPWELRRSLGAGYGYNRVERPEHGLDAPAIVALVTEVIAKGGHILIAVGADSAGVIPERQAAPLREAGTWLRRHQALVDRGRPWRVWGDQDMRFIDVDGVLHVVDLADTGRVAALTRSGRPVRAVTRDGVPVEFTQDEEGLHVDAPRHSPRAAARGAKRLVDAIAVYRIELLDRPRPDELFTTPTRPPIELAPLLHGVRDGAVVQLGDGRYVGSVAIPEGVTVRGLGGSRSIIDPGPGATVTLRARSRLEYVAVAPSADSGAPRVVAEGDTSSVVGCQIAGTVYVTGAEVIVRAINAISVHAVGAERVTVTRCLLAGATGDVGVALQGGDGHLVESCEVHGHGTAVELRSTTNATVRGNNVSARWRGVRLVATEATHVHGNIVHHTMRAVDVDGGSATVVDANAVRDGDSGCVVQWGAAQCQVSGNTWERCRIGVLTWAVDEARVWANEAIDLHDPDGALVTGP